MKLATSALVAVVLGALTWAGQDALPWPALASRSLAGLFLLAGMTRLMGDNGLKAQRMFRYAVGGVALTGAAWFAGGARLLGDFWLLALSALHVLAAFLCAAPAHEPDEKTRGRLVLGITMSVVSLLAISILPAARLVPGSPQVPLGLAIVLTAGAFYITRHRTGGVALAAVAGIVTLVLAGRVLVEYALHGAASQLLLGRAAPLVAATAALGTVFPIVAMARHLPKIWAVLAPNASQRTRLMYAWLTLPAVTGVAVTVVVML